MPQAVEDRFEGWWDDQPIQPKWSNRGESWKGGFGDSTQNKQLIVPFIFPVDPSPAPGLNGFDGWRSFRRLDQPTTLSQDPNNWKEEVQGV